MLFFEFNSRTDDGISVKRSMQVHLILVYKPQLQILEFLSRTGDIHQPFSREKMFLNYQNTLVKHKIYFSKKKSLVIFCWHTQDLSESTKGFDLVEQKLQSTSAM